MRLCVLKMKEAIFFKKIKKKLDFWKFCDIILKVKNKHTRSEVSL